VPQSKETQEGGEKPPLQVEEALGCED